MFYQWYEMTHAALSPARAMADATRLYYKNPVNPLAHTQFGRSMAAMAEVFERVTRRYGKPEFGIESVSVGGSRVPVREEIVWQRPFCRLIHFSKGHGGDRHPGPKLLLVAPMSPFIIAGIARAPSRLRMSYVKMGQPAPFIRRM